MFIYIIMPEAMISGWECFRCEHTWAKRKDSNNNSTKPLRCPSCGSCYWDRKRKDDVEEK